MRSEQVVQEDPAAVERLMDQRDAVDREQEGLQGDEMGGQPEQARALRESLVHEAEVELLQVAQAAVDEA
jgi:hypothetical protein